MPTNTYVALDIKTVTSPVSSVTFTSIPQGYTDLVLIANLVSTSTTANMYINVGNGSIDYGSNYSVTYLSGNGTSGAVSSRTPNSSRMDFVWTSNSLNNTVGNAVVNFMNYTNTSMNKSVIGKYSVGINEVTLTSNLWRSTNAINTMIVGTSLNTFAIGTTFNLYGISGNQVYTPSTIPSSLNVGDSIYIPYTGTTTTLAIPAGVNTCKLEVMGASGGNSFGGGGGGKGGYASGIYTLGGSATTMYVNVGGVGASRTASTGSGTLAGGFNGGGNGYWASNTTNQSYAASGGGGGTDFRVGGSTIGNRIIVAGGGGGEAVDAAGAGAYSTGGNGGPSAISQFNPQGGFGGTQLAGGAGGAASTAGSSSAGNPGTAGQGGNGGDNRTYGQGGGGGGGYYGGGGGGTCGNGTGASGGGGSSYIGGVSSGTTLNGINVGNGYAIFTKVS